MLPIWPVALPVYWIFKGFKGPTWLRRAALALITIITIIPIMLLNLIFLVLVIPFGIIMCTIEDLRRAW